MGLVVWVEVTQQTDLREGVTDGVHHKDANDQEGKDVIGEAGRKAHEARNVEEGCQCNVDEEPNADPCIEGEEGDIQRLG